MNLITAILITIPTVGLYLVWLILNVIEGINNNAILVLTVLGIIATMIVGRSWNKYFEHKKHGKQSKLEDFDN